MENNRGEKGRVIEKGATKALKAVRAMPHAIVSVPTIPYEALDEVVQDQLVRELHTYRRKDLRIARIIWALGGFLGLHRFYLGRVVSGILMLCTAGGLLVWWIVDAFKLKEMVQALNDEQDRRQAAGLPPVDMDFVPVASPEVLRDYPDWAQQRLFPKGKPLPAYRKFWELLADVLAVMFFGFVLGAVTESTGYNTAAWAVFAILLMINFVDYLIPVHHWPVARGMIHWDYKLRLFYQFNEPGRRWKLYFRPLIGLFYAPFNRKARTEVLLYLELGSVFILGRILMSLFLGDSWVMMKNFDFEGFLGNWLEGTILGFFTVYGFVAPIGAIMMKHILLRRPNYVRWGLSLVIMYFLYAGFYNG